MNAAIGYQNFADIAVISASNFQILTPPTVLQSPHIARKMRTRTSSVQIVFDLRAARAIDCVCLFGLDMTLDGISRVRASLNDTSGQNGGVHNGVSAAGRVDPRYGALIYLFPSRITARYICVDLEEPDAESIDIGRAAIMPLHHMNTNFAFGWGRGYVDRSRKTESRGGQTYIDVGNKYRTLSVGFEWVTEAERFDVIEEIDRVNGESVDVLMITDPDSDNLGRDSIWGLLDGLSDVSQGQPVWGADGRPLYQKPFKIKERL